MTGKANLKNGMWSTSPGQDPLLTSLGNQMIECCDENPQGCLNCLIGEKCAKWWNNVSTRGSLHLLTEEQHIRFREKFDIIRVSKNGHKPIETKGED